MVRLTKRCAVKDEWPNSFHDFLPTIFLSQGSRWFQPEGIKKPRLLAQDCDFSELDSHHDGIEARSNAQ